MTRPSTEPELIQIDLSIEHRKPLSDLILNCASRTDDSDVKAAWTLLHTAIKRAHSDAPQASTLTVSIPGGARRTLYADLRQYTGILPEFSATFLNTSSFEKLINEYLRATAAANST